MLQVILCKMFLGCSVFVSDEMLVSFYFKLVYQNDSSHLLMLSFFLLYFHIDIIFS